MASYTFTAPLWIWTSENGPGAWHFVTLPEDIADQIDDNLTGPRAGFGSVKVRAAVGATAWEPSIFPSKEQASFILPVKKSVRMAEALQAGAPATVTLEVLV